MWFRNAAGARLALRRLIREELSDAPMGFHPGHEPRWICNDQRCLALDEVAVLLPGRFSSLSLDSSSPRNREILGPLAGKLRRMGCWTSVGVRLVQCFADTLSDRSGCNKAVVTTTPRT